MPLLTTILLILAVLPAQLRPGSSSLDLPDLPLAHAPLPTHGGEDRYESLSEAVRENDNEEDEEEDGGEDQAPIILATAVRADAASSRFTRDLTSTQRPSLLLDRRRSGRSPPRQGRHVSPH